MTSSEIHHDTTLDRTSVEFRVRCMIHRTLLPKGYAVSGNHVFRREDLPMIWRGEWRPSVSERPELHPARVVRWATALHRTYGC